MSLMKGRCLATTKNPHTRLTGWRVDDFQNPSLSWLEIKHRLYYLCPFIFLPRCALRGIADHWEGLWGAQVFFKLPAPSKSKAFKKKKKSSCSCQFATPYFQFSFSLQMNSFIAIVIIVAWFEQINGRPPPYLSLL